MVLTPRAVPDAHAAIQSRMESVLLPSDVSRASVKALANLAGIPKSKSYDWLFLLISGILPMATLELVPRPFYLLFCRLTTCVQQLCTSVVGDAAWLARVQDSVTLTVAMWEELMPPAYCTYQFHSLLHLTQDMGSDGGLVFTAVYALESFFGVTLRNTKRKFDIESATLSSILLRQAVACAASGVGASPLDVADAGTRVSADVVFCGVGRTAVLTGLEAVALQGAIVRDGLFVPVGGLTFSSFGGAIVHRMTFRLGGRAQDSFSAGVQIAWGSTVLWGVVQAFLLSGQNAYCLVALYDSGCGAGLAPGAGPGVTLWHADLNAPCVLLSGQQPRTQLACVPVDRIVGRHGTSVVRSQEVVNDSLEHTTAGERVDVLAVLPCSPLHHDAAILERLGSESRQYRALENWAEQSSDHVNQLATTGFDLCSPLSAWSAALPAVVDAVVDEALFVDDPEVERSDGGGDDSGVDEAVEAEALARNVQTESLLAKARRARDLAAKAATAAARAQRLLARYDEQAQHAERAAEGEAVAAAAAQPLHRRAPGGTAAAAAIQPQRWSAQGGVAAAAAAAVLRRHTARGGETPRLPPSAGFYGEGEDFA